MAKDQNIFLFLRIKIFNSRKTNDIFKYILICFSLCYSQCHFKHTVCCKCGAYGVVIHNHLSPLGWILV